MIAALDLKPSHRVCEIGTGTGYCAVLLAQLASTIVSLERFQTLVVEATARINAFGLANVAIQWADGFDLHHSGERFDRIIVHGLIEPPGEAFCNLMAPSGVLVGAIGGSDQGEQRIVRLSNAVDGAIEAEDFGLARGMRPLEQGLARAL
jgi:protein-L-isoaspartate(D-aspartate) O-methyltransferase